MSEALEPEGISRRRALALVGAAGALGLAAPGIVLTPPAAVAQAIPLAFNQEDKPLPGERGRARTSPQPDKPILGEEPAARRRRLRRKRVQQRLDQRARRRSKPRGAEQPADENKPK